MRHMAELVFSRPPRYRERALRYRIEVDDREIAPRLLPNSVVRTEIEPGRHRIKVSSRRRSDYVGMAVEVAPGQSLFFEVRPSRFGWTRGRPPVLVDANSEQGA